MNDPTGARAEAPEVARHLVVGLEGTWPSAREAAWLRSRQPAGIILFARNVNSFKQLRCLCKYLHDLVPGGEICADHEGGSVSQLSAAVGRPPTPWALGVLDDPDLTLRVHAETAGLLAEAGIDRVLAPCADVLTEIRNPVIGARAFGQDCDLVSRQVVAAVQGLRQGGLPGCLKHWPGHGGSLQDSHLSAAVGQDTVAEPFLRGLAAGADAVMVGHLQAGPDGVPATLDAERLARWRRRLERARDGAVLLFADDVTMGALRPAMASRRVPAPDDLESGMVDPGEVPLAWLQELLGAGLDRLLIRGIPWRALPLEGPDIGESCQAPGVGKEGSAGEPPAYAEVRQRLTERLEPGFRCGDRVLGWLDLTRGDRWEVAGTGGGASREDAAAWLSGAFRQVVVPSAAGGFPTGRAPLTRLLVTSHRPLPAEVLSGWPLAGRGHCLAMGHPSLTDDLRSRLGPAWLVSSWYDVDWSVLEPAV